MLNITAIVSRIEEVRKNHQLTAASFATKIGVQRSAISHILSGRNKPSLEFLMKIYEAFDEVAIDWLIVGSSAPSPQKSKSDLFDIVEVDKPQTPPVEYPTAKKVENQKQASITLENSVSPKEIIYIYGDGTFERFTPQK